MLGLKIRELCIEIVVDNPEYYAEGFSSDFARRYLPTMEIVDACSKPSAVIYWLNDPEFRVLSSTYSSYGEDIFVVQGYPPEPYINESPVFFLLQVLARALARQGYVMITDSIVIGSNQRNILLMGYPHTGKSTIATIAHSRGHVVYTTENTVVKVEESKVRLVTGSRVLVFDPIVVEKYGLTMKPSKTTRHGYGVIDLDQQQQFDQNRDNIYIDEIYVIYTSFSSTGFSKSPIKGRKIAKLLWSFGTSLIKGLDYYSPAPLNMPLDDQIIRPLKQLIEVVEKEYTDKFYEVFGSPLDVFESITGNKN